MPVDTTYYETLGLDSSADPAAIKKAYRKLALKWHPDKNQDQKEEAEKMFKEISKAYDVLSDPEKKSVYDQYGKDGLDGAASGGSSSGGRFHGRNFEFHDANDIFAQFFGTNNIFDLFEDHNNMMFGGARRSSRGGMMDPFGDMFSMGGMSSMNSMGSPFGTTMSFSSNMGGFGGNGSFSSVSSSTQIINGKRVEKTTRNDNGVETVEIKENGVLTSKIVNGQQQLTNGPSNSSSNQNQIRSGSSSSSRKSSKNKGSSSSSSKTRSSHNPSTSVRRSHTIHTSNGQQAPRIQVQTHTNSYNRPQSHNQAHQLHQQMNINSMFNDDDFMMQNPLFDSFSGGQNRRSSQQRSNNNEFNGNFPFGRDPFGGGFPFGNSNMFGNGFPF